MRHRAQRGTVTKRWSRAACRTPPSTRRTADDRSHTEAAWARRRDAHERHGILQRAEYRRPASRHEDAAQRHVRPRRPAQLCGLARWRPIRAGSRPTITGATASIGRVGAGEVTVLDLPASGWSSGTSVRQRLQVQEPIRCSRVGSAHRGTLHPHLGAGRWRLSARRHVAGRRRHHHRRWRRTLLRLLRRHDREGRRREIRGAEGSRAGRLSSVGGDDHDHVFHHINVNHDIDQHDDESVLPYPALVYLSRHRTSAPQGTPACVDQSPSSWATRAPNCRSHAHKIPNAPADTSQHVQRPARPTPDPTWRLVSSNARQNSSAVTVANYAARKGSLGATRTPDVVHLIQRRTYNPSGADPSGRLRPCS